MEGDRAPKGQPQESQGYINQSSHISSIKLGGLKVPFVGTYVRKLDINGSRINLALPQPIRQILGLRGSPTDSVCIIPKNENVPEQVVRPKWLEEYLGIRPADLSLELTDIVQDNFDTHRLLEVGINNQVSIPAQLKRAVGIGDSIEYVLRDGKVKINKHPKSIPGFNVYKISSKGVVRLAARHARVLDSSREGMQVYVKPHAQADIHDRTKPSENGLKYLEVTSDPDYPKSAYHKTRIDFEGRLKLDRDMLDELGFDKSLEVRPAVRGLVLSPNVRVQRYTVVSYNTRVSMPKKVAQSLRGEQEMLPYVFLKILGSKHPKTNGKGRYWEIRDDVIENYAKPPVLRCELGDRHRLDLTGANIKGEFYDHAIFISRGDYVEFRLF